MVPLVGTVPGSTRTALAGALGRLAVKSVQENPPLVVCHRCDVGKLVLLKPMMLTYAVRPWRSELSIAIPEIGKLFGLIDPVWSIQVEGPAATFVLTHTCPPGGMVGMSGPSPSVPA